MLPDAGGEGASRSTTELGSAGGMIDGDACSSTAALDFDRMVDQRMMASAATDWRAGRHLRFRMPKAHRHGWTRGFALHVAREVRLRRG